MFRQLLYRLICSSIICSSIICPAAAAPRYLYQLSYADAESAIGAALAQKGAGSKIDAIIADQKSGALFSYNAPLTVEIRGLRFNKSAHSWEASLLFDSGGTVISALPMAGRYVEMVSVPVLKRETRHGDVIGPDDVEMRDFPVAQTRSDMVMSEADLLGKSPLHSISPQRPVRGNEIARPAVVRKNTIVQMYYRSPGMEISATGKALGDGAKGDVVSVRNTASRRIVRAVVEDAGDVAVVVPGEPAANLTKGGSYAAN